MSRTLWVTWERQRRNKEIANAIGAEFHEIVVMDSRIKRYAISLWRTLQLYRTRPNTVICQNPSVVLALFTVLTKKLFGFKAGVDTHNGGLALDTNSKTLKRIAKFLQRHADFIIITNQILYDIVKKNGGTPVILPDKIPDISIPTNKSKVNLSHMHNLLFICTFAKDEPYKAVFQAAQNVPSTGIYVTGNYIGKANPDEYPSNLHFLGRVPWEAFDELLYTVDGIIDLTTREGCLVCGAYEAVAVGTPLLLSDTEALRGYFGRKGVMYTNNDRDGLIQGIQNLTYFNDELKQEIKELKPKLEREWEQSKQQLLAQIGA